MIKVLVVGPADALRQVTTNQIISDHVTMKRCVAAYEATGRYQASMTWGSPAGLAKTDVLIVQGEHIEAMAELIKVLEEAHGETKPAQPVPEVKA